MNKGKFIVIEGTDGAGKGTQLKLLIERLQKQSIPFITFDFPQYGKPSAYFVEEYLRGTYGGLSDIDPKTGSLFYALDRFAAAPEIRTALDAGKLVLSNRFTASNMGHQGAKFYSSAERQGFFKWLDELEFTTLKIPRPDLNIILHVPAEIAQTLVDKKSQAERVYVGGKKRDIHEQSLEHLQRSEAVYKEMAQLFPNQFVLIECFVDGRLLSIEEVGNKVWDACNLGRVNVE